MDSSLFVFIKIPESLEPVEREEKYEQALEQTLMSTGLGELTGGGAMLSAPDVEGNRKIEWCGIDVEIFDLEGVELIRAELKRLGAPKGTMLEYTLDGISLEKDIYDPELIN